MSRSFLLGLAVALGVVTVAVLAVPSVSFAQALAEDDAAVPDSLRLESPAERAAETAVPPATWSVDETGEGFDLVFDDLEDDDLGIQEDYGEDFALWPYVHYNRVDAWVLGLDFGFAPEGGWLPEFKFRFAHAFNRDHRWLYVFRLAQPVLSDRRFLVGVEARRFTDTFDEDRVPSGENFLSSFFFKYDYRDYFERRGFSYFAEGRPTVNTQARIAYERHHYESITEIAPGTWSVFNNSVPWRDNPAVDEARLAGVLMSFEYDTRPEDESYGNGVRAGVELEFADDGIGSDWTYTTYAAEGSGNWAPLHNLFLKGRVIVGSRGAGPLPFQKEFAIGGISTLRAHTYKASRGDRVFLGNAEVQVRLLRGRERAGVRSDLRLLGFLDIGQAWRSSDYDLSRQAIQADAGLGLSAADDHVALYMAQDLRNTKFDPLFSIRLSQAF